MGAIFPAGPPAPRDFDAVTVGFSAFDRMATMMGGSNATLTAGEQLFTFFTAPMSMACTILRFEVETARAGGTVSLAKAGIFTANRTTPTATATTAIVSDVTMFDAVTTKDLTLPGTFNFVYGTEYAASLIVTTSVAWTTAPILAATRNAPGAQQIGFRSPALCARKAAQTDLVSQTTLNNTAARVYFEFLP